MDFKFKMKSYYCLKLKNNSFKLKIQYSIFPLNNYLYFHEYIK